MIMIGLSYGCRLGETVFHFGLQEWSSCLKTTLLVHQQDEAYSPHSLEPEGRNEQLTPSCRLKGMALEGRRGLVVLT